MLAIPRADRHFYEILRQGRPCHVYLDVEYATAANPGLDGDDLVDRIVRAVVRGLRREWPEALPVEVKEHVVEMDSSSATKFSRHVVVPLRDRYGGVLLRSNRDVGAMLGRIWAHEAKLEEEERTGDGVHDCDHGHEHSHGHGHGHGVNASTTPRSGEFSATLLPATPSTTTTSTSATTAKHDLYPSWLRVAKLDGSTTYAVDMGVYTPNRAFRIEGSSKFGKGHVLKATSRFVGSQWVRDGQTFHLGETLAAVDPHSYQQYDTALEEWVATGRSVATDGGNPHVGSRNSPSPPQEGVGRSPYPAVDAFLVRAAAYLGSDDAVTMMDVDLDVDQANLLDGPIPPLRNRSNIIVTGWRGAAAAGALQIRVRGTRWCGHVGRQHKSNGIYFTVDLVRGTWAQRCFDPDCRGYRSPVMPLPGHVMGEVHRIHRGRPPWAIELGGADGERDEKEKEKEREKEREKEDRLRASGWSVEDLERAIDP